MKFHKVKCIYLQGMIDPAICRGELDQSSHCWSEAAPWTARWPINLKPVNVASIIFKKGCEN